MNTVSPTSPLFLTVPATALAALVFFTSVYCEAQQAAPALSSGKDQQAAPITAAHDGTPVAKVNGVIIYQSDLACAVEASIARNIRTQQSTVLERIVNVELLYQESLKHRFQGLIEESEQRYQTAVRRLGGEERLASALQCNDMLPDQYRKSIFRNLSINRLLNKLVYSRIDDVTEKEARDYYDAHREEFRKPERVRASQILIRVPSGRKSGKWKESENRALTIYRDAKKGVDFVLLARRYSEDPVSANSGGDIGIIEKGSKHNVFGTTVFKLEQGSISKPIRSHQGFHILKITSTTPPAVKTFEESREEIITLIRKERSRKMISSLLNELGSKAEIEIFN